MDLIKNLMVIFLSLLCLASGSLIRNNEVYESIIKDIFKYFYCKSIIFIHAIPEQELFQDIEITTKLFKLRKYFNKQHRIPTIVININKIISEFGDELNRLSRPLFILLNDSDELRVQLATSLAPGMDMSRAKWLIFISNTTNLEHFFKDTYIPFNCEFCVSQRKSITDYEEIITEIYRVGFGTELRQEFLASWHPTTGTRLPKISLYQLRPRNFHMYTLRAQKIHPNRFRSDILFKKFTDEVLNSLQSGMNFTISFEEAHNKGHCWNNRTCDGAIGALVSQSSDFIANLLNPDKPSDVWKLFDITHPIISFRRDLFIKKLSNHFSWIKFFRPFKHNIWIIIVILIFTISGFLIFIEYHINNNNISQSRRLLRHSALSRAFDSLFFVIGALCNQGMTFSNVTSILIVQFTICITSVVIFASYSAVLISSLTHNVYVPPFTNLAGLLKDGSYEVRVVQNSGAYWFFEASDDAVIKKTYERFMKNTTILPKTYLEDKARLCHQDNYATVFPNLVLLEYRPPDCPVMRLESITVTSLFFFLQRNSPYREFINRQILFSRERKVFNVFFIHLRQLLNPIKYYAEISVEFYDIAPLLIVHLIGVILSCVILFIERRMYENNQRRQCKLDEQKVIYNFLIAKARFSSRLRIYQRKNKRMKKKKHHLTASLWRKKFNQSFF